LSLITPDLANFHLLIAQWHYQDNQKYLYAAAIREFGQHTSLNPGDAGYRDNQPPPGTLDDQASFTLMETGFQWYMLRSRPLHMTFYASYGQRFSTQFHGGVIFPGGRLIYRAFSLRGHLFLSSGRFYSGYLDHFYEENRYRRGVYQIDSATALTNPVLEDLVPPSNNRLGGYAEIGLAPFACLFFKTYFSQNFNLTNPLDSTPVPYRQDRALGFTLGVNHELTPYLQYFRAYFEKSHGDFYTDLGQTGLFTPNGFDRLGADLAVTYSRFALVASLESFHLDANYDLLYTPDEAFLKISAGLQVGF
jgi:hypothetical protein